MACKFEMADPMSGMGGGSMFNQGLEQEHAAESMDGAMNDLRQKAAGRNQKRAFVSGWLFYWCLHNTALALPPSRSTGLFPQLVPISSHDGGRKAHRIP
jgi:hypothetical protein